MPFGPFDDQPFLARCLAIVGDGMSGDHAHEREPRDELTAVDVAERDRPEGLWVKAGEERCDRPRLGLGRERAGRGTARAGLAWRDDEHRAGIKDVALRGDREHVVDPVIVQASTELGVLAIG